MIISKFLPDEGDLEPGVTVLAKRKGYPYNTLMGTIQQQYSTLMDGSKDWIIETRHKNRPGNRIIEFTVNERYLTKMNAFAITKDIDVGDEVYNPYSLQSLVVETMQIGHCLRRGYIKKTVRLSRGAIWLTNGKEIQITEPVNGISKVKCPTCHNFH